MEAGVLGLAVTVVVRLRVESRSLATNSFTGMAMHDRVLHSDEHSAGGHTAAKVGGRGDHVVPAGGVGVQPLHASEREEGACRVADDKVGSRILNEG